MCATSWHVYKGFFQLLFEGCEGLSKQRLATLLDDCEVGEGAIVAAGALVLQGTKIPPHEIWGGVPAKYINPTRPRQTDNAAHYVEYAKEYMKG